MYVHENEARDLDKGDDEGALGYSAHVIPHQPQHWWQDGRHREFGFVPAWIWNELLQQQKMQSSFKVATVSYFKNNFMNTGLAEDKNNYRLIVQPKI